MNTIFRLLRLAKKYWVYLCIGTIGLLGTTAAQLYTPQAVREILTLIGEQNPNLAALSIRFAIILLAVYAAQAVFQFLRSYFMHYAAWHFIADLRSKLFAKLEQLSMQFYHDKQTGQLMSRVTNDTAALEVLIAHALPDLVVNVLLFVSVAVILLAINPTLGLFSLALMPIIAVAVWYYATRVRPIFKQTHQKMAELSAVLQDDISGMKEIQLFNQQTREKERVDAYSQAHCNYNMRALSRGAVYHPFIEFINNLGTVLVIGVGGYLAFQGAALAADIVAFILYLSKLYQPVSTLGRLNEDMQNALAAAERTFELLDAKSQVSDAPDAISIGVAKGKIEFSDVCFSYHPGAAVLNHVSVTLLPGETLALVGPTGVGKTTFISLVARFYDPQSGAVLLDGTDIRNITLESLRQNISIVLQDVFLFNGTVAENIAYGKEAATFDEIVAAAKVANADGFIREMENGYDTLIGERGVRLSGGQKQRLSIARAVLRNSPVLILDEATASVDTATERLIQQAIDKVIQNRTTIMIAHRLSTVRNADKIAVLDQGRICEIGTHEELIAKDGLYRHLCEMQFQTN